LSPARSSKRDIDRAKKERAELKRQRRQHAPEETATGAIDEPSTGELSEQDVLDALDRLHARYAADEVSFDEFETSKTELLSQLTDRPR
jgi:hypothetical protein